MRLGHIYHISCLIIHIVIVVVFKEKFCVYVDVFIDVSITVWMSQISPLLRVKVRVPSAKAY